MWRCTDCIHKNKLDNKSEICLGLCKDVNERLNRENHCYQEAIPKMHNCGCCPYINSSTDSDGYYCSVNNWNCDDRIAYFNSVRKNYLTKNTPKWCQLK